MIWLQDFFLKCHVVLVGTCCLDEVIEMNCVYGVFFTFNGEFFNPSRDQVFGHTPLT